MTADRLTRPVTMYSSPYKLAEGEDIWGVYERLVEAGMPLSFEILKTDGTMTNLLELELEAGGFGEED